MKKGIKKWQGVILVLTILVSFGIFNRALAANSGANGLVYTTAIQSDGKIIIGGDFTTYNDTNRNRIARLNSDGKIDTTFNPGTGANAMIYTIAIQSDGKILIGGDFTTYNGTPVNRIVRLNVDGTLDTTFNPGVGSNGRVAIVDIQTDGKIIVGGNFSTYNDMDIHSIVRLNVDGTLDETFNVSGKNITGGVQAASVQPDGKIIIGGEFYFYNDITNKRIARLNSDGTIDSAFNSDNNTSGPIYTIGIQSDGKVIMGGTSDSYDQTLIRLNTNGIIDSTFSSGLGSKNNGVYSLAIQPDGKIIIAGCITDYSSKTLNNITRLNSDGTLDATFLPGSGANANIYSAIVQPNGKVIIGGYFTNYDGMAANRIARLNSDGTLDTSFNPALVTGITVKTPPTKTVYTEGYALALYGLVVTLTKSDGSTQDVNWTDFLANNITTNKANGDNLSLEDTEIIITANGYTISQAITVNTSNSNDWHAYQPPQSPDCIPMIMFPSDDGTRKKNLVVITHGWNGSADDLWVKNMQTSIFGKTDPTETSVRRFDWKEDAATGIWDAWQAYVNAFDQGECLAKQIIALQPMPENIHLIAHSAGSNVIQTAAYEIAKHFNFSKGSDTPFLHLTFLDPFAPAEENQMYGSLYGLDGYAEQYVDTRLVGPDPSKDSTDVWLPYVTNFDVTALDHQNPEPHFWPIDVYNDSIQQESLYGMGFLFSKETKSTTKLTPRDLSGEWCTVTDISKPYASCSKNNTEEKVNHGNDWIEAIANLSTLGVGVVEKVTVDVDNAIINTILTSATGTVSIFEDVLHLITGSPSWVEFDITAKESVNTIEFNSLFPSQTGEGVFAVFVDGKRVFSEHTYSTDGDQVNHKQIELPEILTEGSHTIIFRLDPLSEEEHSEISISNVHFSTKVITRTEVQNSTIATITSGTYTVGDNTITNVPYGTSKTTFLAALTKSQTDQTWNDSGIANPVTTGNTLIVTAQDRTTQKTYTVTVNAAPIVATPIASPSRGTYTSNQTVTLSSTTSGATIHYTTDGSIPTSSSNTYSSALTISASITLKAIAIKSGMADSAVMSEAYTINIPQTVATPTASPAGGSYTSNQSVALLTGTGGATIYYTTDGSDPNASSSAYSSPLSIANTTTLKAIAMKSGMIDSSVMNELYTIKVTTNTPNLPYSISKKAKKRISYTFKNLSLTNKKYVTMILGGRKVKVVGLGRSGADSVVTVELKYAKWPRGSYNLVMRYKNQTKVAYTKKGKTKYKKGWQTGSVSQDGVLVIQ